MYGRAAPPEMYALSTLLFVSVLVLLIFINRAGAKQEKKRLQQNAA